LGIFLGGGRLKLENRLAEEDELGVPQAITPPLKEFWGEGWKSPRADPSVRFPAVRGARAAKLLIAVEAPPACE